MIELIVCLGFCLTQAQAQQYQYAPQFAWPPPVVIPPPAMPLPRDNDRHPGEGPASSNPSDPESLQNATGLYMRPYVMPRVAPFPPPQAYSWEGKPWSWGGR